MPLSKMLNDRSLVRTDTDEGERRSTGGILIPATAQVGKRLSWAQVVAARDLRVGAGGGQAGRRAAAAVAAAPPSRVQARTTL